MGKIVPLILDRMAFGSMLILQFKQLLAMRYGIRCYSIKYVTGISDDASLHQRRLYKKI